jgi:CPA2 family monovalent cation:H+ antiporter-2
MAVIPILATLPLLAVAAAPGTEAQGDHSGILENLPGWMQTVAVLMSVGAVILIGRYLIVPGLRLVARFRLRELFVASSLLIVIAIAFLMETVGLSPALGTFLGGVVLANSEFKHELESDLDPFKGLLLGLFFIAVGASINFSLIADNPTRIFMIVFGLMAVKTIILLLIGKSFRLSTDQNLLFAFGLSQVGEFAFVLFAYIDQLHILSKEWVGTMMAVVAISMTITPLLLLLNEKIILPRLGTKKAPPKEMDTIDEHNPVILAGFAHFGSTIGRFLRANGVNATILDNDSDRVDLLRKMGFKVYYGDATRYDLLESAGAHEAKLMVIAIDSPEITMEVVETVKKHFPNLEIMVRAKNRMDAYELLDAGVENIYRESIDTSVRLGTDVLKKLGFRAYSAMRSAQNFIKHDEAALWKLAKERHDQKKYITRVREEIELQEHLLMDDRNFDPKSADHAWDSEQIREAVNKK